MESNLNQHQQELKEQLENERYYTINKSGKTDTFVRAWIMIRNGAAVGVNFLNQKRHVRELNQYIAELHLLDFENASEEDRQVYLLEYKQFAAKWIKMCYTDKNYSSTLFGLIKSKATTVTGRIIDDINTITVEYPSMFGQEQHFEILRKVMLEELDLQKANYEDEDEEE